MTELSTSVALHGLSLAVPSKMVGSTALIAGGRSGAASESASASKATAISAAADRSAASHSYTGRVGAGASEVARLATVVATAVATSAAQAQSRAVSLNVA